MTKNFTTTKKSKFLTLFITVLCIAICLSCAELFSSLITVGAFSYSKNNEAKQQAFSLYSIYIYTAQTKSQADEMSSITRKKNGAGYIYQSDTGYLILTSCYENQNDAQKVIANLAENGIEGKLLEIKYDEIKFTAKLNETEKNTLTQSVQIYKNLYKKLYDLSVSVDTNLLTEIKAKNNLNDIIKDFLSKKQDFESIFNQRLTSAILKLKISLGNLSTILDNLYEYSSIEFPYSSQIKNSYFQILDEYSKLSKSI